MSLIVIRHGETELNAARVLQPPGTPLGARGQAQALALAQRLRESGLAGIVSSDLARARQTAQAIGQATGLAVHESPLLQERNFGELRGLAYDSLDHDPIASEQAPPGGESMQVFRERVAQAFEHIVRLRHSLGGPLAVVTHGLVIRQMIAAHLKLADGVDTLQHIANTSVTVAQPHPPYEITLLDCASHLEGDIQDNRRAVAGI
jgi:broad specificity phosphatase PhoE